MKKILIIEDDKKIAAALEIRLKGAGYEVVTVSDGLKGLASAITIKPDLIISDIWLPGAVGFLVAERLKNVGCGGIPVIFVTASKKRDLWKLSQEAGAVAFFEKPYDPQKLLRAISRALEQPSIAAGVSPAGERAADNGARTPRPREPIQKQKKET